jgi:hypothetical protein
MNNMVLGWWLTYDPTGLVSQYNPTYFEGVLAVLARSAYVSHRPLLASDFMITPLDLP